MILIALLIGVVLIIAALRNSQASLFNALGQDVPEFVVWAAALFAVGALGYVNGMKPISRALIALIIVVIILNNYKNILSGFQALSQDTSSSAGATNSGGTSTSGSLPASSADSGFIPASSKAGQAITKAVNAVGQGMSFLSNAQAASGGSQ